MGDTKLNLNKLGNRVFDGKDIAELTSSFGMSTQELVPILTDGSLSQLDDLTIIINELRSSSYWVEFSVKAGL